MNRFHYAASREPEPSFFRIAFPVTAFSIPKPATGRRENVSLTQLIYNMLKKSPTESFFQKFFIFFSRRTYARQIIQTSAFSQQTQSSAASLYVEYSLPLGEQQNPLPVLCTSNGTKSSTGISLNLSRFLIFLHIFFSFLTHHLCIGIFLNLSLSALIPDGREEQSVCSVLVVPCIRSSPCSFLIAVVVASSINANLSLSIFFLPFCSLVSLLHIQYARILRCGYFFCGFFLCGEFVGKTRNLDGNLGYIQKSKSVFVAKRFLSPANKIAILNIVREQGFSPAGNCLPAVSLQIFVNYSRNQHLANSYGQTELNHCCKPGRGFLFLLTAKLA